MKMLHDSEHEVAPDGTLTLHDLEPKSRVKVCVYITDEQDEAVLDPHCPEVILYQPNDPSITWSTLQGTLLKYERPTDPATDPDEWEANR